MCWAPTCEVCVAAPICFHLQSQNAESGHLGLAADAQVQVAPLSHCLGLWAFTREAFPLCKWNEVRNVWHDLEEKNFYVKITLSELAKSSWSNWPEEGLKGWRPTPLSSSLDLTLSSGLSGIPTSPKRDFSIKGCNRFQAHIGRKHTQQPWLPIPSGNKGPSCWGHLAFVVLRTIGSLHPEVTRLSC